MIKRITQMSSILLLGCTLGTVQAQTKWQMPTAFAPDNYQTVAAQEFSDKLKELTDGELDIIVHSGASLLALPQIKRAVQVGDVQIGEVLLATLVNENPIFGLDSVPFLVVGYDSAQELLDSSRDVLQEYFLDQGLRMLYSIPWPPQGLFVPRPVKTIEDLKGLKFRSYGPSAAQFGEQVGASVTTVQVADLTEALRTGLVDSMITSSVTGADSKIWESPVKYYYDLEAWVPRNAVIVNEKAFQMLDEQTQQLVLDTALEIEQRGWIASKQAHVEKLQELKDHGMQVENPSPELLSGLREIGNEIANRWEESASDKVKALLEPYKQIKAESE